MSVPGVPLAYRHCKPYKELFGSYSKRSTKANELLVFVFTKRHSKFSYFKRSEVYCPYSRNFYLKSSVNDREKECDQNFDSKLFDDGLLKKILSAEDANEVLELIEEKHPRLGGVIDVSDCRLIIVEALDRNNVDLALSIYSAMRSSYDTGIKNRGSSIEKWKWSRPDVSIYASLVRGLAASLRVSDAIKVLTEVSRTGLSTGEEISFGNVVKCPTCMIAIAVAQPQHGIHIASCSKCRCQYELVSGTIVSISSEEISMDATAWEKMLRFLQIKKKIPAAVHSIVVQTPSGVARTHKFATETVELPAQEGERVTISSAVPTSVYREMGPLRFNTKVPGFDPGEPMSLTNHNNARESKLLRAPTKNGNALLSPSLLFPVLAVLATGDAASGIIDPSLPKFISLAAITSITIGTTLNNVVLPQLSKLPKRLMNGIALKQQLLSQYDLLQIRMKNLCEATEKELKYIELQLSPRFGCLPACANWRTRLLQLENPLIMLEEAESKGYGKTWRDPF